MLLVLASRIEYRGSVVIIYSEQVYVFKLAIASCPLKRNYNPAPYLAYTSRILELSDFLLTFYIGRDGYCTAPHPPCPRSE